jgi:hypothetical protein
LNLTFGFTLFNNGWIKQPRAMVLNYIRRMPISGNEVGRQVTDMLRLLDIFNFRRRNEIFSAINFKFKNWLRTSRLFPDNFNPVNSHFCHSLARIKSLSEASRQFIEEDVKQVTLATEINIQAQTAATKSLNELSDSLGAQVKKFNLQLQFRIFEFAQPYRLV